eukprot:TRINITY_DN16475_c0_g1_i1.p1 TRINITY_DN16475_c0_g1~~TRINITY_DN16475_c0_g1_i1.p1  ORF type:complete len:287 (+),score=26.01 TRINITY_DN16475_c0_g1_i1:26-886(+)
MDERKEKYLVIMVNSAVSYRDRRDSIRRTWKKYVSSNPSISSLSKADQDCVAIFFCLGRVQKEQSTEEEQDKHGDIIHVDIEESYDTLAKKTLAFMTWLQEQKFNFDHFMHADDDSFIRIDLLLPILRKLPQKKLYWGYIWDNVKERITRPLRDPTAKSYMPYEQYEIDAYPPFACGCGFILSRDLVEYLITNARYFKDFRLVDVAFGIYLYPLAGINRLNEDRVRPYRPLPLFRSDTVIQHYMKPEEFQPFFQRAIGKHTDKCTDADHRIASFFDSLTEMGLLRK